MLPHYVKPFCNCFTFVLVNLNLDVQTEILSNLYVPTICLKSYDDDFFENTDATLPLHNASVLILLLFFYGSVR